MHRAVLLYLAVLVGCASGPPGGQEYHQGAYRPPPPAPHRPGVGLHIPGQRVRKPDVQPQPRPTRILPQTPETMRQPGIWAGDATFDDATREFGVLGVLLPFPTGGTAEDEATRHQVRICAYISRLMFANIMPEKELAKATDAEVACVVARAFRACALKDVAQRDALKARGDLYSPLINNVVARNRAAAQDFVDRACGADTKTPWTARWTGEALTNWDNYDKRTP